MAALIGIVAGAVVVVAALIATCVLIRKAHRKMPSGHRDSGSGGGRSGVDSDPGEMTTTVAATTIVYPPELLASHWTAGGSGTPNAAFDQLSDEMV
jgi:hypothetical protein